MRQLVDQVVDKVGAKYALVASDGAAEQIVLEVSAVDGLNDYAALTRYLIPCLPSRPTACTWSTVAGSAFW
ncbi:MAG: hypothetical protein R3F38_14345 [Gammaproteobacteria bacterium]